MKIAGTGSPRNNATRRKGGADPVAGEFAGHMCGPARARAPAVSGTTQVASVGALVALQGAPGFGSDPGAAEIDRAEDLLDQLDRIRLGMLTGGISAATLQNIVNRLAQRRTDGVEPRLAALIDDIELRARVELAKLSMI